MVTANAAVIGWKAYTLRLCQCIHVVPSCLFHLPLEFEIHENNMEAFRPYHNESGVRHKWNGLNTVITTWHKLVGRKNFIGKCFIFQCSPSPISVLATYLGCPLTHNGSAPSYPQYISGQSVVPVTILANPLWSVSNLQSSAILIFYSFKITIDSFRFKEERSWMGDSSSILNAVD